MTSNDPEGNTDGLGKVLIGRLAEQISATATWSDATPGARFLITFPVGD